MGIKRRSFLKGILGTGAVLGTSLTKSQDTDVLKVPTEEPKVDVDDVDDAPNDLKYVGSDETVYASDVICITSDIMCVRSDICVDPDYLKHI